MADGGDRHKTVAPQGATGGGPHHLLVASGGSPPMRESPPKAVIDTSPILIDQNKESLKVKLLLRRPFDQLVAQGIMPPHKTPAAYHGQRRQLERAKTGDMLKAKIQQRPPRQELERRHILEPDTSHADPSLVERQRMLKKARLADQLNDQLSHRPGPLELIQKNILHTEEPIEQAVKTGKIPYKATSEGQLNRPQHPLNYINPEEDSLSSEGDSTVSPGPSDVIETAAKSAGIVVSLVQPTSDTSALVVTTNSAPVGPVLTNKDSTEVIFTNFGGVPLISHQPAPSPASLVSSTSTLSPLSSIASPVPSVVSQPPTPSPVIPPPPPPPVHLIAKPVQSIVKSDAPGKEKNRKKSKSKSAPKARTIKFHEYKGPPSAQKTTPPAGQSESSYDLLLKQQTLLLQFQLQLQHKYPQIILPAQQKPQTTDPNQNNPNGVTNLNIQLPSPAPSTSSETSNNNTRVGVKLEDMKVSDLKAELKRRNLPVSGSKPQLIERLKPYTSCNNNNSVTSNDNSSVINQNPPSVDSSVHSNISMDQGQNSPHYQDLGSPQESVLSQEDNKSMLDFMEISDPVSPQPQPMNQEPILIQHQESGDNKVSLIQIVNHINQAPTQEDIVREQQRRIEELQRELTLSKMKLQAAQRQDPPKTQNMLVLQKHLQARQQQQNLANQMKQLQALQAQQAQVNEQQQRLQQQQHVAFQNQKNLGLVINGTTGDNNQKNLGLILNGPDAALVFNHLMQGKGRNLNGQNGRSNSLPNFLSGIVTPIITTAPPAVKTEYCEETKTLTQPEIKIELTEVKQSPENVHMVNEADCNKLQSKKGSVKSQTVEDVLEILIKNGELPPSALGSYPTTPQSGGIKTQEPEYPTNDGFRDSINQQMNENVQLDIQTNMNLVDNSNTNDAALGFNPQQLLEDLDNMDFSQLAMELGVNQSQNENNNFQMEQDVPMETDEWLDSLLPQENQMFNGTNNSATILSNNINSMNQDSCTTDLGNYGDPLLGIGNDPFDPFNLEEFRHPPDLTLTWDKLDYAT